MAGLVRNFTASYESVAAGSIATVLRAYQQEAARQHPTDLATFSRVFLESHPLALGDVVLIHLVAGVARPLTVATPGYQVIEQDPVVANWFRTPPSVASSQSVTIANKPVELVGAPIVAGTRIVGTIIATSDLSSFVAERRRVLILSLAEAAAAVLAGVLSTFVLLRRLLRTVGRITETAEEIGSGSLQQRLGDQGIDDEVGALARTFDTMLDRVEAAMVNQRRLLSDVSHQLRTPLTVARGHLEVLDRTGVDNPAQVRETLELVIDELDHTAALVERLLMLGRAMEPDFLAPARIELAPFLSEIHEAVKVLAPRRFELGRMSRVEVDVDAPKLRGALLNLLDNAIRATGPDDCVALNAEVLDLVGTVAISVEDSGPGIPEHQRQAVLRRFARPGARDSDGSGLGLAIAKAVAEAHGGTIDVGASELGGARVTITLPGLNGRQ